jgi:hypothetical protein
VQAGAEKSGVFIIKSRRSQALEILNSGEYASKIHISTTVLMRVVEILQGRLSTGDRRRPKLADQAKLWLHRSIGSQFNEFVTTDTSAIMFDTGLLRYF